MEKEQAAGSAFGALLRRHRLAAGLSQEVLAERARMSTNGISALERGDRRYPYRETVMLLATALGLSPAAAAELEAAAARPRQPQDRIGAELGRPAVPPLRSVDAIPNNLPRKLTSFIGREAEIAEITALVESHQLVTVVGSGGVGKTRTSLAVAEGVFGAFADGVWLIELAPLSRGDYIPGTVAQALGVTLAAEGDPLANLTRALKSKQQLLLVFDNCEHLIADVAKVVSLVLNDCHKVKILATSREPLRVRGEATYRMPSLPVPAAPGSVRLSAAAALPYVAVALFVERARAVDHRFTLTDQNAPVVADICRRLDGIPLAIELAAARANILSPRQLRERLDERFRVLTDGNRDPPRQQTLRALLDWSHDLLDERERVLFRRLGIFVNGFTLEGLIAVAGDEGGGEFAVVNDLASLVDKSLVIAEPDGSSLRYRLLDSTRAYALEQLALAGERELLAGRHLKHFRDRFGTLRSEVEQTMRTGDFEDAFLRECEDVRVALDWACSRGDIIGAELLAEIGFTWASVGMHRAGVQYLEAYVVALPESESRLRSLLSSALSFLVGWFLQHGRALELAELAVGDARKSGDAAALSMALRACATRNLLSGRLAEAGAEIAEAEAMAISKNAPLIRLKMLFLRAWFYRSSGDSERALRCYEQLSRLYRSAGDVVGEFENTTMVAELEYFRGDLQRAIALAREALTALQPKNSRSRAQLLTNLAGYLCANEELSGAEEAAREVLHLMADVGGDVVVPAIEHLALVYALRDDLFLAAVLAGYADRAFQRMGFVREFTEQATRDRLTAIFADRITPAELQRLSAEGAALAPEVAIELALGEP